MSSAESIAAASQSFGRIHWFRYASPQTFYPVAGKMIPWFAVAAIVLSALGLYIGLFVAPADHQQGEAYRIIFLHVPAAWLSMFIYIVMAFWAGLGLVLNTRLSSMMASALASTGAMFTFLALWSGALWGRPTWGTWWVWDAHMLTDYSVTLAMSLNQSLSGEPERLIDRALAIDPNHVQALALSGSAAYERGEYAKTIGPWKKTLAMVPADADIVQSITASVSKAEALAAASLSAQKPLRGK